METAAREIVSPFLCWPAFAAMQTVGLRRLSIDSAERNRDESQPGEFGGHVPAR